MKLQKAGAAADKEIEGLKTQNLELIHQRDYYQDQVGVSARAVRGSLHVLRSARLIARALPQTCFFQAKKFHENMENLRTEANKLINDANERENKSATELERLVQYIHALKIDSCDLYFYCKIDYQPFIFLCAFFLFEFSVFFRNYSLAFSFTFHDT